MPTPHVIIYEDEHILVANKPPGWNTHVPSPYATAGIYEWLKGSCASRNNLSIVQRLDKGTSGIVVFPKSNLARQSLTQQFMNRQVYKKYTLLSHKKPGKNLFTVRSFIRKESTKFLSEQDPDKGGEEAITQFEYIGQHPLGHLITAIPFTGRTHQVRIHAAEAGFPVLGDELYGGMPYHRLCLHASWIRFKHPHSGKIVEFYSEPDFTTPQWLGLRQALFILVPDTNIFRLIHGSADSHPGLYVDLLGETLLLQSETPCQTSIVETIKHSVSKLVNVRAIYWKIRTHDIQKISHCVLIPQLLEGETNPHFIVHELGLKYIIKMDEGYSIGLFHDQRENRWRILTGYIQDDFILDASINRSLNCLNLFAYTCSFSVCAAKKGWRTINVDISKKYLQWGQENFRLNKLDPTEHEFWPLDVWTALQNFKRRGRKFDFIIVDPPSFSRSKVSGVFKASKDYKKLMELISYCAASGAIVLASCNMATLHPKEFTMQIREGIKASGRKVIKEVFYTQPPDFPSTTDEPAYLKAIWLKLD